MIPEEQLEFTRVSALVRQFGWEVIEQRVIDDAMILTLRKTRVIPPAEERVKITPPIQGPT